MNVKLPDVLGCKPAVGSLVAALGKAGLVELVFLTIAHVCGSVASLWQWTVTDHPRGTVTVICPLENPSKLNPVMFSVSVTDLPAGFTLR